uniref:(California timema) hypothetical protein n=1 Tax=Timema californicum TaxID=61474 RepID=A0A7R9J5W0_TIMCA|nr:unnamed protein product [Timema californicum]
MSLVDNTWARHTHTGRGVSPPPDPAVCTECCNGANHHHPSLESVPTPAGPLPSRTSLPGAPGRSVSSGSAGSEGKWTGQRESHLDRSRGKSSRTKDKPLDTFPLVASLSIAFLRLLKRISLGRETLPSDRRIWAESMERNTAIQCRGRVYRRTGLDTQAGLVTESVATLLWENIIFIDLLERPRTRWIDQEQKDMRANGLDWRRGAEGKFEEIDRNEDDVPYDTQRHKHVKAEEDLTFDFEFDFLKLCTPLDDDHNLTNSLGNSTFRVTRHVYLRTVIGVSHHNTSFKYARLNSAEDSSYVLLHNSVENGNNDEIDLHTFRKKKEQYLEKVLQPGDTLLSLSLEFNCPLQSTLDSTTPGIASLSK